MAAAKKARAPEPAPQRDFLVIYEEDDEGLPGDDHLVLDIESPQQAARGELDVQQRLDLELSNKTNRMGTTGFAVSCLGGLLGAGLLLFFLVSYPGQWYNASTGAISRAGPLKPTVVVGAITLIMLIVGTLLTHYGRRIQARGNLSQVRIVEKAATSHARMR
ncbi:MAG: hypothetical protein ACYDBQ_11010 [Thermoplasmatota archaeon]